MADGSGDDARAAVLLLQDSNDMPKALLDALGRSGFSERICSELPDNRSEEPALCFVDTALRNRKSSSLTAVRSRYPHVPVIAWSDVPTIEDAVLAVRAGAVDYLPKSLSAQRYQEVLSEHALPPKQDGFVAGSEVMRTVLAMARRVAATNVPVMILGESGSGKEVIARFLHDRSPRRTAPFVAINCAAIPEAMLEATLFGHERGAFTGAVQARAGKFEQADGGTLLLDEITEMPLGLQAKLLRVLQEREVERVGGRETVPLDVRVLATSNRNLQEAIADGVLREDLYYRLNVFPLTMPALRERKEDLEPLCSHFLHKYGNSTQTLTDDAVLAIAAHDWPGNVRELENVLRRAMILSNGPLIEAADLGLSRPVQEDDRSLPGKLRNAEDRLLLDTLRKNGGVRKATATELGISERTLRYKLRRLKDAGVLEVSSASGASAAAEVQIDTAAARDAVTRMFRAE